MSGPSRNAADEASRGQSLQSINPATGEHGQTYRLHTLEEARSIAAGCAAAQKLWRSTPIVERSKLMQSAAQRRNVSFTRRSSSEW